MKSESLRNRGVLVPVVKNQPDMQATLATDKVDEPYDLMWARITEAILRTEMTALSGFID